MPHYVDHIGLPPRTFTTPEVEKLLAVTGEHRKGFRDHFLLALAFGTALREHEIVALNVGDVVDAEGRARRRVELRVFKRATEHPAPQEVVFPERLHAKLVKYLRWKKDTGESLAPEAPLFVSQRKRRLSTRRVRKLVAVWQERAGFQRHLNFHAIRHTACSTLYHQTQNILAVQRLARHSSVLSTRRYMHLNDDAFLRVVQGLPC